MPFDPNIAEMRFGCGLSPGIAPPASAHEMLARLTGPDHIARQFPIETFDIFRQRMSEKQATQKRFRKSRGTILGKTLEKQIKRQKADARRASIGWFHMHLMRRTWTEDAFRERLTGFWADHFTTRGRAGIIKRGASPYVETAIRPNMTGLFEDLLIAAVTHPMMVDYLDQGNSMGNASPAALKLRERGRKAGLNENLAREVLELHTLGVGAGYDQSDVRELAELLTGLGYHVDEGRKFRPAQAEPGSETVLGKTYGGDPARFEHIEQVLRDLARHPATAEHIARKLAVHFVSDTPDPALVNALKTAFLDTGGALIHVYEALLTHPASWSPEGQNVRPPFDFIAATMRALGTRESTLTDLREPQARRLLIQPLRLMGHSWETPTGPDGLYEADTDWITPQAMAVRVQWAMRVPQRLVPSLPDPRKFVEAALGHHVPDAVRFAATNAESVSEAIGLVLMSPAFQRS